MSQTERKWNSLWRSPAEDVSGDGIWLMGALSSVFFSEPSHYVFGNAVTAGTSWIEGRINC